MDQIQGIYKIEAGITADFGFITNCFLIEQDGLILVDTGLPGNTDKILSYITRTDRLDPADIHTILLTHYHLDHTGNVIELQEITGAKVAIHSADAHLLTEQIRTESQQSLAISTGEVHNLERGLSFTPDILLTNDEFIHGLQCIHLPGHSPGNIAILDPERKALFCGDTIFGIDGKITIPERIQERMRMMGTWDETVHSVKQMGSLDFDTLFFGHGDPVIGDAKENVLNFINSL